MNKHFLTGFFKQAALHNISENEALGLLKTSAKGDGTIPFVTKLLGKRRVTGFKNMSGAGRKNPATGKMEYPDSRMYNRPSDKSIVKGTAIGAASLGAGAYVGRKSKKDKNDTY